MRQEFDRHSSKPPSYLDRIRSRGRYRMCELSYSDFRGNGYPNKYNDWKSVAYSELYMSTLNEERGTFVDAGCGDSPDAIIARLDGYKRAVGLDLFPQFSFTARYFKQHGARFKIQDICERWPFKDSSVDGISCSAVLDLLTEDDRVLFYKEAFRVLKPRGKLSCYFVNLANGHGTDVVTERDKCTMPGWGVGFKLERNYPGGFVMEKPQGALKDEEKAA